MWFSIPFVCGEVYLIGVVHYFVFRFVILSPSPIMANKTQIGHMIALDNVIIAIKQTLSKGWSIFRGFSKNNLKTWKSAL